MFVGVVTSKPKIRCITRTTSSRVGRKKERKCACNARQDIIKVCREKDANIGLGD